MFKRLQKNKLKPINFCVVGSGQAFKKYWTKAWTMNHVEISKIISLEEPENFESSFPSLKHAYLKSLDLDHTYAQIPTTGTFDAIALLIPSHLKLELTNKILNTPSLSTKKIFIEKPYDTEGLDMDLYRKLVEEHGDRLHFSSKYAFSRADIFIEQLLKEKTLPKKFTIRMFEGSTYYNIVMEQYKLYKRHLYIEEGPELDLGFHMLDIVARFCSLYKDSAIDKITIQSNEDLSDRYKFFKPKFGFGAKVTFILKNGAKIPVELEVGKADCNDERYVIAEYSDKKVKQTYTTNNATDPVELIIDDKITEIARHPIEFNYYSKELLPEYFGKQTKVDQLEKILINEICIELKKLRLKNDLAKKPLKSK